MHSGFVVLNDSRPAVTLQPLQPFQRMFLSGGKAFQWRGCSAFLLGMRHSLGENIDPFRDWAESRGFNVLRVFSHMVIVPQQRGYPAFQLTKSQMEAVNAKANERGIYIEWTSGDWQLSGLNPTMHNLQVP